MFNFDPRTYTKQYASEGFVHIPSGVTEGFYAKMAKQVSEYLAKSLMKEFAIGDKQQAKYEFPEGGDYVNELVQSVATICGVDPKSLVLSERHIKAYDSDAKPNPLAHKDRFASEVSLGISVHVPAGSTLVMYPYDENEINPFNSSTQLRLSFAGDRQPEPALSAARVVEINDKPGDVVMFRGHSIWHLRRNPANTTMLYLKLNTFNCDPLGEDPRTGPIRAFTAQVIAGDDDQLQAHVPLVGRRVDYVHRLYNRDWREVIGVVLWGEQHFTIDDHELKLLQAIDGRRTVAEVIQAANGSAPRGEALKMIRRLSARGVVDLVEAQPSRSSIRAAEMAAVPGR
jgi:hypothetical protein